jgi:hypothetical protein
MPRLPELPAVTSKGVLLMQINQTARAGLRLACCVALACSAILLPAAALAASAAPGAPAHPAAAALHGSGSGAATRPQRRQLAVTTLSSFKVVLTATRLPGTRPVPMATVTAAGYRNTSHGWKLIANKKIRESFWYSVGVCSFTATQSKPSATGSPSMVRWDSVTVSLSVDPSIGCAPPITRHWR